MENLLNETLRMLALNNKTIDDVLWIGGKDFTITKEEFMIAADKHYDDGYGAAKVAQDLVIVGKDWWLERYEYDGAECWMFKSLPTKPKTCYHNNEHEVKVIVNDKQVGWHTLKEINNVT